jgi:hypothetical protein
MCIRLLAVGKKISVPAQNFRVALEAQLVPLLPTTRSVFVHREKLGFLGLPTG